MAKILLLKTTSPDSAHSDTTSPLSSYLETLGHRVSLATNADECVKVAQSFRADLIILMLELTNSDSLDALIRLQDNLSLRQIPTILIAEQSPETEPLILEALDIGAQDFLPQPCILPLLGNRVSTLLRLKEHKAELRELTKQLSRLTTLDPLTEAYNRQHFLELANTEFAKAQRFQRPLSIIMLELDHFKKLRDTYGSAIGDAALIALTDLSQSIGRSSEIVGRFGDTQFVMCCPDTDAEGGVALAERLRECVEQYPIIYEGRDIHFTVSIGTTYLHEDDKNLNEVLRRADQLLYHAKENGRNRCSNDVETALS